MAFITTDSYIQLKDVITQYSNKQLYFLHPYSRTAVSCSKPIWMSIGVIAILGCKFDRFYQENPLSIVTISKLPLVCIIYSLNLPQYHSSFCTTTLLLSAIFLSTKIQTHNLWFISPMPYPFCHSSFLFHLVLTI